MRTVASDWVFWGLRFTGNAEFEQETILLEERTDWNR